MRVSIVAGTFTNTTGSTLQNLSGGSVLIKFLDSTKIVTNSGTMSFQLTGTSATMTMQVGSDATPGTFVNAGTFQIATTGAGKPYTLSNLFVNAGTMVLTNSSSSPTAQSVTVTKDFTNQANSTVKMFVQGASAGNTVTLTTGNYVNLGTNTFTLLNGTAANEINLKTSGSIFSNAASGIILLTADNLGTNLVRVGTAGAGGASVVNAGTISVGGGTLLFQSTGGSTRGILNSGTITMLGGNLQAGDGITNFNYITGWGTMIGNVINTNGTILADARNVVNRNAATLTVALSTFTNNNGATIGAIGSNSTLLVAIANGALINNGTLQLSAGNIVLSNTLTGTTGGSITNFNTIAGVGDVSTFPIVQGGASSSLIAKDPTDGLSNLIASVGSINASVLGAVSNANGIATLQLSLSGGATVLSNAGTLSLQGGNITINGVNGTVTNTGQIIGFGSLTNAVANTSGSIVASNGVLNFFLVGNQNSGLLSNFNATTTLRSPTNILVNTSTGRIVLNGGTLQLSGSWVTNQGTLTGPGTSASSLYNDTTGVVVATNGTLNVATGAGETNQNFGTYLIQGGNAGTLNIGPAYDNNGIVSNFGGFLTGGSVTNKNLLVGFGTNTATFVNALNGSVRATNGVLGFTGAVFSNAGTINIANNATLNVIPDWNNTGTITNNNSLIGGNVTNTGTIVGLGNITIAPLVVNNAGGSLIATNGTLTLSTLPAQNNGTFVMANGATLTIAAGGTWTNAGTMSFQGGIFSNAVDSFRFINTGTIIGRGTNSFGAFSGLAGTGINQLLVNAGNIIATNGLLMLNGADSFNGGGFSNLANGIITIATNSTLAINKTANFWQNSGGANQRIVNAGTILLQGGTFSMYDNGVEEPNPAQGANQFIYNSGTIIGAGTLNASIKQTSTGITVATNGVLNIFANSASFGDSGAGNFGTYRAATTGVLKVVGTVASGNTGVWRVDQGGTLEVAGSSVNLSTALLPASQLNGTVQINSGANLTLSSAAGGMTLGQNGTFVFSPNNGTTMAINMDTSSGALQAFTNNGTFLLVGGSTGSATFRSGNASENSYGFINNGTIIAGSGGSLVLQSDAATAMGFSNTALGTIIVTNGSRLRVLRTATGWGGAMAANAGTILLNGGTFQTADGGGLSSDRLIRNLGTIIASGTGNATNTWQAGLENAGTIFITNNGAVFNILSTRLGMTNTATGVINLGAANADGTIIATNIGFTAPANFGGAFVNLGTVRGQGTLTLGVTNADGGANANFNNYGSLIATNYGTAAPATLFISSGNAYTNGGFSNAVSAVVTIATNTTLTLNRSQNAWANSGILPANSGTINLAGGTFNLASDGIVSNGATLFNSTGAFLGGFGTLSASVTNSGFIVATNGTLTAAGIRITGPGSGRVTAGGTLIFNSSSATFGGIYTNLGVTLSINSLGSFNSGAYNGVGASWVMVPSTNTFAGNLGNAGTILSTNSVNTVSGNLINEAGAAYSMFQTSATYVAGIFTNLGALNVLSGSVLTNGNAFILGGSTAIVSDAGSVWSNATLTIGSTSTLNRVTVSNGAALFASGPVIVGSQASASNNTLNIGGAGATSSGSLTTISLGGGGFNTLAVTNAALVSSTTTIGSGSSNNLASVTAGGAWSLAGSALNIGSGAAANNVLTIGTGGTVSNAAVVNVAAGNAVNMQGGLLHGTTLTNFGTVSGYGGITNAIVNNNLVMAVATNLTTAGTLSINMLGGTNGTPSTLATLGTNSVLSFALTGGQTSLLNLGTITLSGGTVQFNAAPTFGVGAGTITNRAGGTIVGVGNVVPTVINSNGTVLAANPISGLSVFSVGFGDFNDGTIGASNGATLNVVISGGSGSTFNNSGTIGMLGGTLVISNAALGTITNRSGAVISGFGTIMPAINNLAGASIIASNALLNFGLLDNLNSGLLSNFDGSATLRPTNDVLVNAGTIALNGGLLSLLSASGSITNTALIFGPGAVANSIINASAGTVFATNGLLNIATNAGAFVSNRGLINVGSNSTLNVGNAWNNTNSGLVQMNGGFLTGGTLTNTSQVTGFGAIVSLLANIGNGLLTVSNGVLTLSNAPLQTATFIVTNGGTLNVAAAWNNAGTINMGNGTIIGSTITNGSFITGFGTITPVLVNNNFGTVVSANGTLTLAIAPLQTGTFIVTNSGTLNVQQDWNNAGSIRFLGGTSIGGVLTNNSTISGFGTITSLLVNQTNGTVYATSGTLTINLAPVQLGTMVVSNGGTLAIQPAWNNSGTVDLRGGTLVGGNLTNLIGGRFSGFGTISAPSLINSGTGMATSLAQVLRVTSASVFNQASGVFGADSGRLIVDAVFTNAGTVSFLNSYGTFNSSVVNRGAWLSDPSTLTFNGDYTVTNTGYISMAAGDVYSFKSNFFNFSTQSNQYDTAAGKFIFDGNGANQTQVFAVAGINLGGWNTTYPGQSSNEIYVTANGATVSTNSFTFYGTDNIGGYSNNFSLGNLTIGSGSTLVLVDTFGLFLPTDNRVAGLYVDTLTINPGSLLIISNNVELFFKNSNGVNGVSIGLWDGSSSVLLLNGSSFHQINVVPEPSVLLLMILGAVGIYYRRRRRSAL